VFVINLEPNVIFSPTPQTMRNVSQNLQNVARISRQWKRNGKRVKSADPGLTGRTAFDQGLSERGARGAAPPQSKCCSHC